MTVASHATSRYLDRPSPSSLADVVDTILDKGMVIDIYVRVSLLGIELLTIDARIVVASVDTYLRFAEAVNRLDLTETKTSGPDLLEDLTESGMNAQGKEKARGALESVEEKVSEVIGDDEDEQEEKTGRGRARKKPAGTAKRASRTRKSSSS
ncbi:MAG: gas vesicle protein GvpJ [Nocardioidaceae bacterium]